MIQRFHNKFCNIYIGIGCFEGTLKLRVKEGSHPYQTVPRRVAYALQQPLKEELVRLMKQEIIEPMDVDETSE